MIIMANIQLNSDEVLIKESMANRIEGKMNVKQGTLFLTSKRLVFHKRQWWAHGLIGVFSLLLKGKFEFEIPLNMVSEIAKTKYGFNKNIFTVKAANGSEYRFVVKFADWLDALKNTYIAHTTLRLMENGEEKWKIK
jgi:hypothetical protein